MKFLLFTFSISEPCTSDPFSSSRALSLHISCAAESCVVNMHPRQTLKSLGLLGRPFNYDGVIKLTDHSQLPSCINTLKAGVSQTRNKQGWAVTHHFLPHLETAAMQEDYGNEIGSMHEAKTMPRCKVCRRVCADVGTFCCCQPSH